MSAKNSFGLTPKQEKFAQNVANGKTLADAYRSAYPTSKKWVDSALHPAASKLMVNTKVRTRVDMLRAKAESAADISREKLLREIARLAFSDPRRLVKDSGAMVPFHELDDDTAAAIASVEVDEYGKVKYKLWDKGAAQEKLAKHLGLYEKDNGQKGAAEVEALRAILASMFAAGAGAIVKPVADAATYGQDGDDD